MKEVKKKEGYFTLRAGINPFFQTQAVAMPRWRHIPASRFLRRRSACAEDLPFEIWALQLMFVTKKILIWINKPAIEVNRSARPIFMRVVGDLSMAFTRRITSPYNATRFFKIHFKSFALSSFLAYVGLENLQLVC